MKPYVAITEPQLVANLVLFTPHPHCPSWSFKKQIQIIKSFHPKIFHCVLFKEKG